MLVKFIGAFFIVVLFDFCVCGPLIGKDVGTTMTTEKMVKLPQSLVEKLIKNEDELQELKELLKATKNPQNDSEKYCPVLKFATSFQKLVQHIKQRIKKKKATIEPGNQSMKRTPKIVRIIRNVDEVVQDVEKVIRAGREIKSNAWNLIKAFIKEVNE